MTKNTKGGHTSNCGRKQGGAIGGVGGRKKWGWMLVRTAGGRHSWSNTCARSSLRTDELILLRPSKPDNGPQRVDTSRGSEWVGLIHPWTPTKSSTVAQSPEVVGWKATASATWRPTTKRSHGAAARVCPISPRRTDGARTSPCWSIRERSEGPRPFRPHCDLSSRSLEEGTVPGQGAANRIPSQSGGGIFGQEEEEVVGSRGGCSGSDCKAQPFPIRSQRGSLARLQEEQQRFLQVFAPGAMDISTPAPPSVVAEVEQLQTMVAQLRAQNELFQTASSQSKCEGPCKAVAGGLRSHVRRGCRALDPRPPSRHAGCNVGRERTRVGTVVPRGGQRSGPVVQEFPFCRRKCDPLSSCVLRESVWIAWLLSGRSVQPRPPPEETSESGVQFATIWEHGWSGGRFGRSGTHRNRSGNHTVAVHSTKGWPVWTL